MSTPGPDFRPVGAIAPPEPPEPPAAERLQIGPPRPEPMPRPESSTGRGSLARRLVLQVVGLVALVAVALGALTTLAVYQLLLTQLDRQVVAASGRLASNGPPRDGPRQQAKTLIAVFPDGDDATAYILGDRYGVSRTLSGETAAAIHTAVAHDEKATVLVDGAGRYRVLAQTVNGGQYVVGLPMADIDGVLVQLVVLEAILAVIAMGGAAVGARALIARSLRPLNRLAATATQVSRLPLDRGEVALAVRVPEKDADPRSEVGRVGLAFNHMLSNVDGALAARQASESKLRQFVADASHELRNPLAAIRGYSELTRRSRAELNPDAAFAMSRVESEAERMSRLVEDMLLLARLDSGPNIDVGPTDLTETLINATADARAAGPDHRWSLDLPDQPIVVNADRHRIHQVLVNLLANARTHTPPGTSVRAGLHVVDGRAVVSVTDDGPGIPEQIQGRVFERFTRADASRARADGQIASGSTGLGLAIVAAVVQAHRGAVWVESRPGRTVFSVALPLVQASAPASPSPAF